MIIGKWNKSVILTYVGLAFAVAGMVLSFAFEKANYGICCLMMAGICDLFDGSVARMCKRDELEKAFGIELDSLVDVLSFIALPIALSVSMGYTSIWFMLVYIIFGMSGIARLAYFNLETAETDDPVRFYTGLPVTYTALIIPVVYLLSVFVDDVVFQIVYAATLVIIAVLGVLRVSVVKPRGVAYICFGLLAIALLVLYLVVI